MSKQKQTATAEVSDLEKIAEALDSLATEATELGEERVAKSIANAAKSARWSDKQRANRLKKFGGIVKELQAKGLSAQEIIEALTGEEGGA